MHIAGRASAPLLQQLPSLSPSNWPIEHTRYPALRSIRSRPRRAIPSQDRSRLSRRP